MRRLMLVLVLTVVGVHASFHLAGAGVVCNEFDLIAEVSRREVLFRLSTDLPDDTIVMTSVSRLYWQEGKKEAYSGTYYQKRTSVCDLKQLVRVTIDDDRWETELKKKQKMFASLGDPIQVRQISDEVELDLTVPVNQSNAAFGKRNENLEGPFVSKEGLRTIRVEQRFNIPIGKARMAAIAGKIQYNLDPSNLGLNLRYRISKKTPISRERALKDPLKAIAEMQYLPPGSVFRILQKDSSRSAPYYYVQSDVQGDKNYKITGWIYSPALIGQDLEVVE